MLSNYPPGSDGPDAPWNAPDPTEDMDCILCGNSLDYTVDIDDYGDDVYTPDDAEETPDGWVCRDCMERDEEGEE